MLGMMVRTMLLRDERLRLRLRGRWWRRRWGWRRRRRQGEHGRSRGRGRDRAAAASGGAAGEDVDERVVDLGGEVGGEVALLAVVPLHGPV
jgi:hypothetical protein